MPRTRGVEGSRFAHRAGWGADALTVIAKSVVTAARSCREVEIQAEPCKWQAATVASTHLLLFVAISSAALRMLIKFTQIHLIVMFVVSDRLVCRSARWLYPSNVSKHCACAVGSSIQFDEMNNRVKAVFTGLSHLYVLGVLTATVLLRSTPRCLQFQQTLIKLVEVAYVVTESYCALLVGGPAGLQADEAGGQLQRVKNSLRLHCLVQRGIGAGMAIWIPIG